MNSKRIIQTAQVCSIRPHTDLIREYEFKMENPDALQFRAGQFLMLHIPSKTGEKDILRAYSLASGEQHRTQFRLIIKYIENGIASDYFWKLEPHQQVRFTAPFGKLFFPDKPSSKLYFLSTGSGLAPHLSYIETFIEKYPQSEFHFLIGVRTQNDFFFIDYLNEKKKQFQNFHYEFVLSRPDSQWTGKSGYLQKQIPHLNIDPNNTHFFICGYEEMAKATKQTLLDFGLTPERILVEIF